MTLFGCLWAVNVFLALRGSNRGRVAIVTGALGGFESTQEAPSLWSRVAEESSTVRPEEVSSVDDASTFLRDLLRALWRPGGTDGQPSVSLSSLPEMMPSASSLACFSVLMSLMYLTLCGPRA